MGEEMEVGGKTMSAGELDFYSYCLLWILRDFYLTTWLILQFLQLYHGRKERKRTLQN